MAKGTSKARGHAQMHKADGKKKGKAAKKEPQRAGVPTDEELRFFLELQGKRLGIIWDDLALISAKLPRRIANLIAERIAIRAKELADLPIDELWQLHLRFEFPESMPQSEKDEWLAAWGRPEETQRGQLVKCVLYAELTGDYEE